MDHVIQVAYPLIMLASNLAFLFIGYRFGISTRPIQTPAPFDPFTVKPKAASEDKKPRYAEDGVDKPAKDRFKS